MPFNGSFYEEVLKTYEQRRMMRRRERDLRLQEVYARDAEIEALDVKVQSTGAQAMMQILENPAQSKEISQKMQTDIASFLAERKRRMLAAGFAEDYTEMVYDCPLCEDTGYVDGKICECLRTRAARAMKVSSDIAPMLDAQNFENFNLNLFKPENREIMQENLMIAKKFVENFGLGSNNLLFYGGAGCGKTFLSSCIANALIENNVDVVYKSAVRLFADYLDHIFNRADTKKALARVMDAQLLIIDDLGTEAVNQHTVSYLFQIMNERAIRNKPTVISTNLTPKEISGTYTERVSSRVFERYEMVEFPGEDLRLKKNLL